jgi:hypothetical protein
MNLKKMFLVGISIISLVSLNAQSKYAKIVVYRNENTTSKVEEVYKIFADDNLTTNLRNYSNEEFYMPHGSFMLKVNEIFSSVSKIECESGKTYYYRINRNFILPDKPITIVSVDSVTANNELKYLKSYFVRKPNDINIARRNGIGINLEPGIGFESIQLLGTTSGAAVMHSFGGGASFGLNYSYKFSDYFGWSAELSHQFSILSPHITNGDVTFDQSILSTTPYFTIPVIKRKEQKIKIGGGIDYHFSPVLIIETEKIPNGFNDNWTYTNAFGYHFIAFYEGMITPNVRGHVGFKYSDVQYSYLFGEKYQPNEGQLKTPRGNSLFFSLGAEYCF